MFTRFAIAVLIAGCGLTDPASGQGPGGFPPPVEPEISLELYGAVIAGSPCQGMTAPEGHHYELDQECFDAALGEFADAFRAAITGYYDGWHDAHESFEADKAHAEQQRDACIADADGDAEAIAACQQQFEFEMSTAENDLASAVATVFFDFQQAKREAEQDLFDAVELCCELVRDPPEDPEDPEDPDDGEGGGAAGFGRAMGAAPIQPAATSLTLSGIDLAVSEGSFRSVKTWVRAQEAWSQCLRAVGSLVDQCASSVGAALLLQGLRPTAPCRTGPHS